MLLLDPGEYAVLQRVADVISCARDVVQAVSDTVNTSDSLKLAHCSYGILSDVLLESDALAQTLHAGRAMIDTTDLIEALLYQLILSPSIVTIDLPLAATETIVLPLGPVAVPLTFTPISIEMSVIKQLSIPLVFDTKPITITLPLKKLV